MKLRKVIRLPAGIAGGVMRFMVVAMMLGLVAMPAGSAEPVKQSTGQAFKHPREYRSGDAFIYIYLRKADGKWVASPQGDILDPAHELIRVYKHNWSYGDATAPSTERLCFTKMKDRAAHGYLTCNSAFYTVNLGSAAVTTALRGVLSLGILTATDAMTGKTGFTVSADRAALDHAVTESGAVRLAKDTVTYRDYKAAYDHAETSHQLQAFIGRYDGNYDPEGLVAYARQRRLDALENERQVAYETYRKHFATAAAIPALQAFVERYANEDPDNLVPSAREKLDTAQRLELEMQKRQREAKLEQARQEALLAAREEERARRELAEWRERVKAGEDTFCGPIIEIKKPMVRIALRVQLQGFGNDAWLKIGELFPPQYGCKNVNGRLSAY